ncbi:SRPBCC domain-containing protein [Parvularcula dongshanensis]|uniref:Uncharacterized protein YndB with AHSA1/START domain n=1 Tax=Parvularcula dongshanensis TaxID=1173995 RepID=A0A840I7S4_9PROT|nr:SRPBCC domain-containing protein [Parvularcula dongshanensis]MBB4660331.1 uncharacterized protein YndB with AHSA1/START domain [Parvularcula dongshanensis]
MKTTQEMLDDPNTLHVDRTLSAPPSVVWRCWTEPELLKQWYCPKPWFVSEATLDVRPGGPFDVVMNGPAGERMLIEGRYAGVEAGRRLVFERDPDRATSEPPFVMTGFVELSEAAGDGTRMIWGAAHPTPEDKAAHEAMGFEQGWNAAADQLEALASSQTSS